MRDINDLQDSRQGVSVHAYRSARPEIRFQADCSLKLAFADLARLLQ
jgi:hypothetical protein